MAIQETYNETMGAAKAGVIANTEPSKVISRNVEDAAGIGFGKVVQQGAADGGATADLDTSDMDASTFLGITARDRSVDPANPDKFAQYDSAKILREGVIWVMTGAAVNAGTDVTVTLSSGALASAAVASGIVAIPNARWETSTTTAALAKLRLG